MSLENKTRNFKGSGAAASTTQLNFILSASDLPSKDRGCLGSSVQDPYVKLSYKSKASKDWTKFGVSGHLSNNPNPEWLNLFSFDWTQGTGQVWLFEIFDHDTLSKDDPIGNAEVTVDSYVLLKNQELSVKLSCGGTLHIKKTDCVKFRLSAENIPHLDPMDGLSDPFVECYWSFGARGPLNLFTTTKVIKNVEYAEWPIVEFTGHQRATNQYWTFKVYDHDLLPKNDVIGEVTLDVDAFLKKRVTEIFPLSTGPFANKAKLIIEHA